MKKVTLLFTVPLAMLMADFRLMQGKLIPTNEPVVEPAPLVAEPTLPVSEPTPPVAEPTPPAAPSISGVIPNSLDLIWEDSFGANTGDPAGVSQWYDLFDAVPRTFPLNGSFPKTNVWYEVIEGGDGSGGADGSGCIPTTNTATNTVVELGRLTAWIYYEDGGWEQFYSGTDHGALQNGVRHPNTGDNFVNNTAGIQNYYGCPDTTGQLRLNHMDYVITAGLSAAGNGLYKPNFGWIYHGWNTNLVTIDYGRNPKAVLTTLWSRLAVQNTGLPDDRANANYTIHIGSDQKELNGATLVGDIGMSKWKRVTSEWQPINFVTGGWTKAQFEATNPPISSTPQ